MDVCYIKGNQDIRWWSGRTGIEGNFESLRMRVQDICLDRGGRQILVRKDQVKLGWSSDLLTLTQFLKQHSSWYLAVSYAYCQVPLYLLSILYCVPTICCSVPINSPLLLLLLHQVKHTTIGFILNSNADTIMWLESNILSYLF
jgi:hypothetical protein